MNNLCMELKVCEGCGALWLRAGKISGVYCRTCATRLAEFPAAKGRRVARTKVRLQTHVFGTRQTEATTTEHQTRGSVASSVGGAR